MAAQGRGFGWLQAHAGILPAKSRAIPSKTSNATRQDRDRQPDRPRDRQPGPGREFSRRRFVQTSVGSGFAAAVLPVTAQTISTPADGLLAGTVEIAVGEFKLPAYRAQPAGQKNLPVVLVASEIFGVHEHIADVCRRFARQGYLAVAPELFARQGDAKAYTDIPKLISEVVAKAGDAQVMGDLDAALAWAGSQGGDVKRAAVTGFCWGGRTTWMYAAHNPGLKAAAAWYRPVARSYYPATRRPSSVRRR